MRYSRHLRCHHNLYKTACGSKYSSDLHTWSVGISAPCRREHLATALNDLLLGETDRTDSRGTTSDADADSSEAAATVLVRGQILKSHLAEFIMLTTQEFLYRTRDDRPEAGGSNT